MPLIVTRAGIHIHVGAADGMVYLTVDGELVLLGGDEAVKLAELLTDAESQMRGKA